MPGERPYANAFKLCSLFDTPGYKICCRGGASSPGYGPELTEYTCFCTVAFVICWYVTIALRVLRVFDLACRELQYSYMHNVNSFSLNIGKRILLKPNESVFCEHDNELPGFINDRKFVDQLNDC
jgi:hypothetical protein